MKNFMLLNGKEQPFKNTGGKKQKLVEKGEPDLFRYSFPYTEVPKTTFDGTAVSMDVPDDIWMTCTTFRDGQQARPPYTVNQIIDLYDMLHQMGGPNGVIRQCEFFLYSNKDQEAVRACLERNYKYPEVTGWIRATASDFKIVKSMGLKETGILTSASDYHIYIKLKSSREKVLDQYLGLVKEALAAGVLPRCHLEDITRADIYGFAVPFVQELMKLAEESKVPIKVRLCDTMGYGIPFAEAALPRGVPKLVTVMRKDGGVPSKQLEWHGHNDFHKVLINGVAAWLYGCSALNGALLGYGERTGNPPLEGACIEYASLTGNTNGMDLSVITRIGNYFRNEIKAPVPANYPFVGKEFNVTMAGIHADGVIKNQEIYNIFDTEKILNRPLEVTITDKSGIAGVAFWINSYLKLEGDRKLDKHHPGIAKVSDWVNDQYTNLRTTGISREEMEDQVRKHFPEYLRK